MAYIKPEVEEIDMMPSDVLCNSLTGEQPDC
mgnify:FL=1